MTVLVSEDRTDISLPNRNLVDEDLWNRLVNRILSKDAEFEKYFGDQADDIQVRWAERILDQTLGFLRLCAEAADDDPYSPAPLVDIGWHCFILHTHEYEEFCRRLAGRFIHHVPSDDVNPNETIVNVMRTVNAMKIRAIGVDRELWPYFSPAEGSYGPQNCYGQTDPDMSPRSAQ